MSKDFSQEIFRMTDLDEFKVVNHNETRFEAFNEFQSTLQDKFANFEKEQARKERLKNLKRWDDSQAGVWKEARLNNVRDKSAAQKVIDILKSNDKQTGFFIRGGVKTGKTFFSLSIVRALIGQGYATPSQVYQVSEDRMLASLKSGFQGYSIVNEPFDSRWKIYLFDNVGQKEFYDERESAYWEQLLDHISRNNLIVIFTSNGSATGFKEKLSHLSASRLDYLLNERVITLKSTRGSESIKLDDLTEEEREVLAEQEKREAIVFAQERKSPSSRVRKK